MTTDEYDKEEADSALRSKNNLGEMLIFMHGAIAMGIWSSCKAFTDDEIAEIIRYAMMGVVLIIFGVYNAIKTHRVMARQQERYDAYYKKTGN